MPRWGVLVLAACIFALSVVAAPGARSAAERLDQTCDYDSFFFVASYTSSQSVTPTVGSVTRWEARLGVIDRFSGTITSRLVLYPTGDMPIPTPIPYVTLAGPGVVLAEAASAVAADRFGAQWVSFKPAAPVPVPPLPPGGKLGIDIDFPADPSFQPYGGHIGWARCGAPYTGGLAWQTLNPDSLYRAGISPLPPASPEAGGVPLARQSDVRVRAFEFRLFGS